MPLILAHISGKIWHPHSNTGLWEGASRKRSIQQRAAGSASKTGVLSLCVMYPLAHHPTQREALICPVLLNPTTQELLCSSGARAQPCMQCQRALPGAQLSFSECWWRQILCVPCLCRAVLQTPFLPYLPPLLISPLAQRQNLGLVAVTKWVVYYYVDFLCLKVCYSFWVEVFGSSHIYLSVSTFQGFPWYWHFHYRNLKNVQLYTGHETYLLFFLFFF